MFEPFQQFVAKAANRYGMKTAIDAAKICHDFRELMPLLFDESRNPREAVSPAYFKNSTLTVNVTTSAWAQEIITRREKIITEMNKKAGREVIKSLRTQIKNLS